MSLAVVLDIAEIRVGAGAASVVERESVAQRIV